MSLRVFALRSWWAVAILLVRMEPDRVGKPPSPLWASGLLLRLYRTDLRIE